MLVHENFAAHFQDIGCVAFQMRGHGADRPNILRDVVADGAITARRGVTQSPFSYRSETATPSTLGSITTGIFSLGKSRCMRAVKIRYLFFGISVVEAEHRHAMRDLRERLLQRLPPTRWVGESSEANCGNSASKSASSR